MTARWTLVDDDDDVDDDSEVDIAQRGRKSPRTMRRLISRRGGKGKGGYGGGGGGGYG